MLLTRVANFYLFIIISAVIVMISTFREKRIERKQMKEKDFKSLSVDEQKEKINELIASWYDQDSDNRCAIVILGDRKDKKDAGKTSCGMLGPGDLIVASLGTALDHDKNLKKFVTYGLMGPLGGLLSMLNNSEKEEE